MTDEDYLPCSSYENQQAHAAESGFAAFLNEETSLYFFALLDADGKVLLKSEGYPQQAARENGIQSVIKNRVNKDFYSVKSEDGKYYLSLRAANYREIARSCSVDSEADALALIPFATGEQVRGGIEAVATLVAKERANDKIDDDYLACKEYEGKPDVGVDGLVKFTHENGQYYFAWYDEDNSLLMRSEGYPTTAARDNGMASVAKNRELEERYSTIEKIGRHFVILKAGNHQEIARSCSYDSAAAAMTIYPSARAKAAEEKAAALAAAEAAKAEAAAAALAAAEAAKAEAAAAALAEAAAAALAAAAPVTVAAIAADTDESNRREDNYLACSEYAGQGEPDENGIVKWQHSDGQYYFSWVNADGSVKMRSEGYPTTAARNNGADSVVKNRDNEARYGTIDVGSKHFVILKAGNHQEIARSCVQDTPFVFGSWLAPAALAAAFTAPEVVEAAPVVEETPAAIAPVVETTPDVEDDYMPCREYEGRNINDKMNNVALFKHDNGQYYFAVYNTDGSVRLRSEGFRSGQDRDKELSGVLKNLNNEEMYSVLKRGEYYIKILKDKTGREVGRSCLLKEAPAPVAIPVEAIAAVAAAPIVAAAIAPEPPKVEVEADVEDDYIPCKEYEGRTINDKLNNVALFKHDNGQYYFAIYHADGSVRLRSEGFRTGQDRDKELSGALKNLNNEEMYTVIKRGIYFIKVLKDKTGREVGRSCLLKEEPKPFVAPVAAVAAVAAAAAFIPNIELPKEEPKVVVPPPPPPPPVYTAAAPIVEEEVAAAAAGGFNWWWLLLPLLLLGLLWFAWKGCNKETVAVETPAVTAIPPVVVDTVKSITPPVSICLACDNSSDEIFTSVCNNPKKLSRLGTNPEFGNSHALSPEEFYAKLKKAYNTNAVDKEFLDRIYTKMGYTGFADAKPEQFSAVIIPEGTSGKLGYSTKHKTGCYTLPDAEYHRKAFKLQAANGCHLHFMKTCGNHFFFCSK